MNKFTRIVFAGAVLIYSVPQVLAAEPVAIIEDVDGQRKDIQFMDFLDAGTVIKLSNGEQIVIGYVQSCIRESITGGTITIEKTQSRIAGGKVSRNKVECAPLSLVNISGGNKVAAAVVFRGATKQAPPPSKNIYGVSPVIRLSSTADTVEIIRVDSSETPRTVSLTGKTTDLAKSGVMLTPGGVYRLTSGDRSAVIKISPNASMGGAIIGRLVIL